MGGGSAMTEKLRVVEKAVELSAKVGHVSRQSFKSLLEDKAKRTERLRWSELRNSGFFTEPKFIDDFEYLTLSAHGSTFASSIGFTPAATSGRTQVLHDEVAAQFAQWLERQKFIRSWTPEIQLKKSRGGVGLLFTQGKKRKFPDILFDLDVPGPTVRVALEIEISLKTRRRYRDILYAYTTLQGIDTILFVTRNDAIANAIREVMADIRFPESAITVLFANAEQIQREPGTALLKGKSRVWTMPMLVQWVAEKRTRAA